MSDYEQHLLPYLGPAKIKTLSCGHVIPPSNLLAVPVVKASNGTDFDFTFEGRNKESTVSFNSNICPLYTDGGTDHQPRTDYSQYGPTHP
jgi:hypothetical protein